MDTIKIHLEELKKTDLNVQEYITLTYIYHRKEKEYSNFVEMFGPLSSMHIKSLVSKGYLKQLTTDVKGKSFDEIFSYRNKMIDLFEGEKDYFIEWFGKFPAKTPTGRHLSSLDPDTVMGKDCRKKWNRIFKNDARSARKAIQVLEAEMKWRRLTNKMEFMHNAKTWLNQGDYENYAHLLETDKTEVKRKFEDFK